MSKKTLLIILIVIIFIALDVVGYVFFFQNKTSLTLDEKADDQNSSEIFPTAETRLLGTSESNVEEDAELISNKPTSTDEALEEPANLENGASGQTINPDSLTFASLTSLKLGTTTKIFLVGKANGNLYEYLDSGKVKRLSNTTFSGIEEVFWGQDKDSLRLFLRRYVGSSYNNTAGTISLSSNLEIEGVTTETLSDNLLAAAVSPNRDKLFVLNGRSGGVDGYVGSFSLTNQQKIFSSPLSEWSIQWPNQNYLAFQTKPSSDIPGYLFFLNIKDKSFDPILRNIPGLTSLTKPDLSKVFYTRNSLNGLYTYLYDVKEDKSSRLSLSTLPEKCVWSKNADTIFCAVPKNLPKATYPDDWYQGKIQFNDALWAINSANGNVELISDSQNLGDLINLNYNPSFGKIFAIDRTTKKLRVVDLNLERE